MITLKVQVPDNWHLLINVLLLIIEIHFEILQTQKSGK